MAKFKSNAKIIARFPEGKLFRVDRTVDESMTGGYHFAEGNIIRVVRIKDYQMGSEPAIMDQVHVTDEGIEVGSLSLTPYHGKRPPVHKKKNRITK